MSKNQTTSAMKRLEQSLDEGKQASKSQNWRDSQGGRRNENRNKDERKRNEQRSEQTRRFGGDSQKFDNRGRRSEPFKRNEEDREWKRRSYENRRDSRHDRASSDFYAYQDELRRSRGLEYKKVQEVVNDLFKMSEAFSLAHCVAEDMNMGSGIAVEFRRKFRKVDELLNQNQGTGGLAVLQDNDRYIYYLVTKRFSSGKPTLRTLFDSLKRLKSHVVENKVEKLAMPRIGCGLDRLEWDDVKFMLEYIFQDVDVEIVICNLEPTEDSPSQRHKNCKVTHERYPIQQIDVGTVILYFTSADGHVSEEMQYLDEKFHFLGEFKYARKLLGDVVVYKKHPEYLLCGCVVREAQNDSFDFGALMKCLGQIQKENKALNFYYYAFQALPDDSSCLTYKIINILRNYLRNVEIYVCWPGNLQNFMQPRDRVGEDLGSSKEDSWRSQSRDFPREKADNADYWSQSKGASQEKADNADYWSQSKDFSQGSEEKADNTDNYWEPSTSSMNDGEAETSSGFFETDHNDFPQKHWYAQNYSFGNADNARNFSHSWPENQESTPVQSQSQPVFDNLQQNVNSQHEFEMFELELESGSIEHNFQQAAQLPGNCSVICFARDDLIFDSGAPEGLKLEQSISELFNQNPTVGQMVYTKQADNFFYCAITHNIYNEATKQNIFFSLQKIRDHVVENHVKRVAVPKCEESSDVKFMLGYLLGKCRVEIIFAPFTADLKLDSLLKRNSNKVLHSKSGIFQMKKKSVLIYLAPADGSFTDEMNSLDKKYNFGADYRKTRKVLGDVIINDQDPDFILCGCLVRFDANSRIQFDLFQKALEKIHDKNLTWKFPLVCIPAMKDQGINLKILTMLLYFLKNVTVTMCWPGDLRSLMPSN